MAVGRNQRPGGLRTTDFSLFLVLTSQLLGSPILTHTHIFLVARQASHRVTFSRPKQRGQSWVRTIARPQLRELSAELCLKGGLPVKAQHLWWLTIPGLETANMWLEEERPILRLRN